MDGVLVYRHHEELRSKLYDPDNATFQIPLKRLDVMRQTQTRIKNVSGNTTNDMWIEAKGVNLSEEWTGTTGFQILRRFKGLADQTVFGLKLGHKITKNELKN